MWCRLIRCSVSLNWGRLDTSSQRLRGTSGGWKCGTLYFPKQLWAPRSTPFTLKKGYLPLTGILADGPPECWADDLDQLVFKGNPLIEEVLFFQRESRTVILDDLIQIHPIVKGKPFRNALFKLAGVASPDGGVPHDIRMTFSNRKLARRSLERLLSWDFDRLIIAQGLASRKMPSLLSVRLSAGLRLEEVNVEESSPLRPLCIQPGGKQPHGRDRERPQTSRDREPGLLVSGPRPNHELIKMTEATYRA